MTKRGATQMGLQSEALRSALEKALAGEPRALEDLLARFGGLPSPRPNLTLAAAFGEELAGRERALPLLERLARDDAPGDTARAFLPVAAAYGLALRVARGADVEAAWEALFALATDDRPPVRIGVVGALAHLAPRIPGGADVLVARFARWSGHDEDREERWSALAVALEVVAERHTLAGVTDEGAFFAWLERVVADVTLAPRAAERSVARRRAVVGLPPALAAAVSAKRGGAAFFEARCAEARDPELRRVLEETIERLRKRGGAEKPETLRAFAEALASSKKPPRDPTRSNEAARGRGRKARGRGA